MPPVLALSLCAFFVALLLAVERKQALSTSYALWVPTLWLMICGSRPVGLWFGGGFTDGTFEEGNPFDRNILTALMLLSFGILFKRSMDWQKAVKDNFWLIVLLLYLGVSILWSDYPFVSMKRWIRLLGAVPVAMVVLTEASPREAFERILRRCTYLLVPFSLVLIKYYPTLGASYSRWSGVLMWNGVTLTKNALAHLCLISVFFIAWSYLKDRRRGHGHHQQTRETNLADGSVLGLGLYLLVATPSGAYSATSIATIFVISAVLFILFKNERRAQGLATIIGIAMIFFWIAMISMDSFLKSATSLLGRDETLTGRSDLWEMLLADAWRRPVFGTGFGSYFGTGNVFTLTCGNTGHNGLLDVFVETGATGVALLICFLLSLYQKVQRELNAHFSWGVFAMGILVISLLTNYTESLFLKSSSYIWNIMVFVSILSVESNVNFENS